LLLADAPFERFLAFSDWMFATTRQTHQIAVDRLYTLVFDGITTLFAIEADVARDVLSRDYVESGAKGLPKFMQPTHGANASVTAAHNARITAKRQARHRRESDAVSVVNGAGE
jgi:hypothetical protein